MPSIIGQRPLIIGYLHMRTTARTIFDPDGLGARSTNTTAAVLPIKACY